MRRVIILVAIAFLVILIWGSRLVQIPPTVDPANSPILTPTLFRSPTATPEPLILPGSMGEWTETAVQFISRFGPWVATVFIVLLVGVYFLWKVGEEVVEEEAKGIAGRLRRGARLAWYRLTRRLTPEERVIIKEVRTVCERLELSTYLSQFKAQVELVVFYKGYIFKEPAERPRLCR